MLLNIGEIFTYNLRKALEDANKSQRELADAVDVHVNTVQKWLTGQNDPSFAKIQQIADYLNIPPQVLLGLTGYPNIEQLRHELHATIDQIDNPNALKELNHLAKSLNQKAISKKEIG